MEVLTVDEAAAVLKVNKKTVYGLLRSGRLRARKVGRDWRVTDADIKEYLNTMPIDEAMEGDLGRILASRSYTNGERGAYGYSASKDHRFEVHQPEGESPKVIFVPGPDTGGGSGFAVSVIPRDTVWR